MNSIREPGKDTPCWQRVSTRHTKRKRVESIHGAEETCCAHFRETATIREIFLLLWRRFHAEPGIGSLPLLIAASLHASEYDRGSRMKLAGPTFAVSTSSSVTKREPIPVEDRDGIIASSMVVKELWKES
jgi:hypothetical protein